MHRKNYRIIHAVLAFILLIIATGIAPSELVQARSTTPPQINGIFNPDTIYPSQTSRLTINVFNPNINGLIDVHWTDHLHSAGYDIYLTDNPNPLVSGCGSSSTYTLSAVPGAQSISLSGATVDGTTDPVNPGTCSVTVSVTAFIAQNHTDTIDNSLHLENYAALDGTPIYYEYPAQITLLVLPMQAPSLTKTFTNANINAGQTSQLSIAIKNNDPNVALTGVLLNDDLPAGMTVNTTPTVTKTNCGSGLFQGSTDKSSWHTLAGGDTYLQLSGASIAAGATCTIGVTVKTNSTGTFTNTIPPANLVTDQKVTIPSDASANLVVKNVDIKKSFNPVNFQSGDSGTAKITVSNPDSTHDMTNLAFIDTLPAGLTVVSGSGSVVSSGACAGTVITTTPGQISVSGGVIPAGAGCDFTATVTASPASTSAYTNTLYCSAVSFDQNGTHITNPGCSDTSANLTVYGSTLGVGAVKSFDPLNIAPGTATKLTITVTAPADINLTNFSLTDNLPTNVTFYSIPGPTQDQCGSATFSPAPASGGSVLHLTGGTILKGKTCTVTVQVTSNEYGPHTNSIGTGDISDAENRHIPSSISADFTVRDISVSKTFANSTVGRNGVTALTIRLTNNFTNPLTEVAFTDNLPPDDSNGGIIISDPSNLHNTCNGTATANAGSKVISLTGGSIASSQNCTITVDIKGTSALPTPPGTTYTNRIAIGDVTGKINGTTATKNWHPSSDSLTVGSPDFRINKKFDPILVTGDTASTLTVTLVNPGTQPLSGITFTDSIPTNMLLADPASPSVGTCGGNIAPAGDRKSFTFSGGALAGNASCKLTIKAVMIVTGNLINTIGANSVATDQGATNLQPTSATLTNLSSVAVTKKFAPNPVSPGSVSQLTLTIKKVGIGIGLTGLGVTDTLTGGLTIASSPAPTTTCGGTLTATSGTTSVQLSGGTMPVGVTSCTIVVSISAPSTGLNPDGYQNCVLAGTVVTNEGYTNIMDACDTLNTIFDPPTGYKVFNAAGLPELEWKMVWINNSDSNGINVQIRDNIPAGTTYIPGSIFCTARGVSTTAICTFDAINKQVFWQGSIGPDRGATDETSAQNEVVIDFRVNVPDSMDRVNNQATSTTDTNGDHSFTDENTSASVSVSNQATWYRASGSLPETGFAPNRVTILPIQPLNKGYTGEDGLWLEVPSIYVRMPIVGVPEYQRTWDVSWLGNQAGWLNGTAFPGRDGNSVLTGHVYDANGKPGPFAPLKNLKYGDKILVHAWGQRFEYEVRATQDVDAQDVAGVLKHETLPWLTLVTCRDYNEKTRSYLNRTVVSAVLVKVGPE